MKQILLEEIKTFEGLEDERQLAWEERDKREQLKVDLEKVLCMQEISRRQKSRSTWLKEGDRNTGFFHRLANSHRRNNFISSLCIEGNGTSEHEKIKDSITQYYKKLFSETAPWRPKLDGLDFPGLDPLDVVWLERPFQEEEVLQALLSMDEDKALSPDGFSIAFYRSCWSIIKANLMSVFHNFHKHERFDKSLSASFIALIPKKDWTT
ncbi:uncharacterized protein LOC133881144 [Alnus glutinosa]|uniref:uncharacterized protein LOC133881144 n=1 Tax=Alnus glutinosa TaxID=3517 RepID=UPI002D77CB54|nr:uncharacterized protein LOC133881144 [Alnus glutinosa]